MPIRRTLCVAILIAGAQSSPLRAQADPALPGPTPAALRDLLIAITLEMFSGWEPQRGSAAEAIARASRHFVEDSSFATMIDATYRGVYRVWAERMQVSIPQTFRDYRSQQHHVTTARLLPLGPEAAVLTVVYHVDFERADGRRGTTTSGPTLAFVRRSTGWKIAHYHGSHGAEVVGGNPCGPP